jgi:hypothetical protein
MARGVDLELLIVMRTPAALVAAKGARARERGGGLGAALTAFRWPAARDRAAAAEPMVDDKGLCECLTEAAEEKK